MPKIDFIISNAGHHAAMMRPVVVAIAKLPGYSCRVVSLCEFRGITSPAAQFDLPSVRFIKIVPTRFRSSSTGRGQGSPAGPSRLRRLARSASWYLLLRQPLERLWAAQPDLVILPNDAAFPYNLIVRQLHEAQIPFVLVQEGIRFELPARGEPVYGQGGATAVAAWGENSAAYFRLQGVPPERIWLTGNPRFDHIAHTDWRIQAQRMRDELGLADRFLLFLSNPIDDQGFCSSQEKLDLVGRFITSIGPLFRRPDFRLVIKLHGRESWSDFQKVVLGMPFSDKIRLLQEEPLYPLFCLAQAAVVLASTVGLEALLFGMPLAVLEIPGTGFVFDYVSGGAAQGLTWQRPMVEQTEMLLARRGTYAAGVETYVNRNLAVRQGSAGTIARLITDRFTV